MEKIVKTKEQLKQAVKSKEKTIIIEDAKLAEKIVKFKKIKGITKWSLVGLTTAAAAGLALAPFTAGSSTIAIPGMYSLTAGGLTISTASVATISGLFVLGVATLYSIYKGYDVELDVKEKKAVLRRK